MIQELLTILEFKLCETLLLDFLKIIHRKRNDILLEDLRIFFLLYMNACHHPLVQSNLFL